MGTMERTSKVLAELGVNILFAECNRAAHHFAIWNAVLEFEMIKVKHFPSLRQIQSQQINTEEVRKELRDKLGEIKV